MSLTTRCRLFAVIGAIAIAPTIGNAQLLDRLSNPRFDVPIEHPPRIVLKGVTKVSVLDWIGDERCAPELTLRLSQALTENGKFEVIDRANLTDILNEQGLQNSGSIDRETAVKLGGLLGPAAILTGRITRCSVAVSDVLNAGSFKDRKGRVSTKYVRRATAQLTGSVSLIDLTTGKIYAGSLLNISDTLVNEAFNAYPEAPSKDEVLTRVFQQAVNEASTILLPWTEIVKVTVFDDGKCGLKQSANLIKVGDFAGAAEDLRASIAQSCNAPEDTKLLAKAHYNLGMALAYSGRAAEGLQSLRESARLRDAGITTEAMQAVQLLMSTEQERQMKEATAVALGADAARTSEKSSASRLTNADVIQMTKAKLSSAIILAKIKGSPCKFDTSTNALVALSTAGVTDQVMLAMTEAAETKCK